LILLFLYKQSNEVYSNSKFHLHLHLILDQYLRLLTVQKTKDLKQVSVQLKDIVASSL